MNSMFFLKYSVCIPHIINCLDLLILFNKISFLNALIIEKIYAHHRKKKKRKK